MGFQVGKVLSVRLGDTTLSGVVHSVDGTHIELAVFRKGASLVGVSDEEAERIVRLPLEGLTQV